MGWLYTQNQTRRQLIEHVTKTWEHTNGSGVTTCLARACRGNNLWAVFEAKYNEQPTERFIMLIMMKNGGVDGWGYKDVSESMGPYQDSCPLGFLDMVPEVPQHGLAFRERVRAYHMRTSQKLAVNQVIKLTNTREYRVATLKPLRAVDMLTGILYRVPRRMLTTPQDV